MTLGVYAIFDRAALQYGAVQIYANSQVAYREFGNLMCQNSPETLARIGRDYELYKIGEFDSESSELSDIVPVRIGCGIDFVKESADDLGRTD